jgi:hypothetical protein
MSLLQRFQDIAVIQSRANILFLQSQLELAKAVVQAKDASIQALDFVVFQQRQLLSEPSKSHGENVEPLLVKAPRRFRSLARQVWSALST